MKKKILVTGGAGFVGSHLCERLAQNPNYEVISDKTKALGWSPKRKLAEYIQGCRENRWR
ncbi:NAD-dependent epimerase/dehydratase family protein [Wolinella succinogenes]|uniref:NAD-dependent epimerase/dehydratase family protein n=1 Tax=Wolinella succinogenes TaxID=844 RepID=UPI00240A1B15|nr:NAD-dependent epimerase/dehydratase family protein [Wolinella succinogenes]